MIYLFVSDLIGVKENSNIIQYVIKSRIGLWIHRLQLPLGSIVSDSVSAEFLYVLCRVGMFSPVWVRKGRVGKGGRSSATPVLHTDAHMQDWVNSSP